MAAIAAPAAAVKIRMILSASFAQLAADIALRLR
jgi:hypothetical protein